MKDAGKLLRLFRILNLLASRKRGYSVQELADMVGVSYRTVYRDLVIFESAGFSVIQHEASKRYYLAKSDDLSNQLHFNKEEAGALEAALVALPDGPIKQILRDKVQALSGSARQLSLLHRQGVANNFKLLAQAINEQKQVILLDYRSASSHQISNRLVEPFAFSDQSSTVQCYEPSSKSNKFFKLERIGQVRIEQIPWQFAHLHEAKKQDVFGMTMKKPVNVDLMLGLLSSNLLKEEWPAAAALLTQQADGRYRFQTELAGYEAVGRFVLGLIDDIELLGPPAFKKYLQQKCRPLLQEID